jgi:hypothetical protein
MSYSLNILPARATKVAAARGKLSMDHSSLDSNAWLAGFTEADGYFGVSVTEFKPPGRQATPGPLVRWRARPRGLNLRLVRDLKVQESNVDL